MMILLESLTFVFRGAVSFDSMTMVRMCELTSQFLVCATKFVPYNMEGSAPLLFSDCWTRTIIGLAPLRRSCAFSPKTSSTLQRQHLRSIIACLARVRTAIHHRALNAHEMETTTSLDVHPDTQRQLLRYTHPWLRQWSAMESRWNKLQTTIGYDRKGMYQVLLGHGGNMIDDWW